MKKTYKAFALLSYMGPLVLVPFVLLPEHRYVRFHLKQGLILLCIEAGAWTSAVLFGRYAAFFAAVHILTAALSVAGVLNVLTNSRRKLPFISIFADRITI
jgi:hypothetical protein